ncbi:hypothetical protein [uncultured Roseovarius sp.]|uniref:hypothetical protein n=1 Tax=uncultured Roseovarius sp. TaxID=293344 RepID=UPI00263467E7|nr:hypothetical protein [uncultured Roseovarius sp.]
MARLIARLAQNTGVHVAVGFLAMGSWAVYANSAHPMPKPLLAGLVQGALSGAITYALKRSLDGLRARMARGLGWWLPPLIALALSLCLLVGAHFLAGTPEIARTISVPYSVACLYAVTYNFLMWRRDAK